MYINVTFCFSFRGKSLPKHCGFAPQNSLRLPSPRPGKSYAHVDSIDFCSFQKIESYIFAVQSNFAFRNSIKYLQLIRYITSGADTGVTGQPPPRERKSILKRVSHLSYTASKWEDLTKVWLYQQNIIVNHLKRATHFSPNSTWLNSTWLDTMSSTGSTRRAWLARLAWHDESDSHPSLLCNFYEVMVTVIHVLFYVSYSLIYWF